MSGVVVKSVAKQAEPVFPYRLSANSFDSKIAAEDFDTSIDLPRFVIPCAENKASGKTKPATNDDIGLYSGIGVFTFCQAREIGVEFPKAVGIVASTYAFVLKSRHGGVVAAQGIKPLTDKQLFGGAETQIILRAVQTCPKNIPADVMAKVEELKKKAKSK